MELSQQYFGKTHQGYILGAEGLAHVTLCQFRKDSDAKARHVFGTYPIQDNIDLQISEFRVRQEKTANAGFYMAEILVVQHPHLMWRQEVCYRHLVAEGLTPLTAFETYAPHITLARLATTEQIPTVELTTLKNRSIKCGLVVGPSTESGVLKSVLSHAPQL